MKKFLTIALALLTLTVNAQDVDKSKVQKQATAAADAQADLKKIDTGEKAWKFTGQVGLNAAATGLWNWTAGGNNNISGRAYSNLRLLYHKNGFAWDSNLDMEYGLTWIDQEYDKLQKSADNLNFATKFGWEFHKTWYLTVLGSFQSQFAHGRKYSGDAAYDPIVSNFLAPAYTDISVGIDWKPNDIFSVYISPVAGRLTSVYITDKLNNKINAEYKAEMEGTESYDENYDLRENLKETYGVWHYEVVDDASGLLKKNYDKNLRAELGLSFKGQIDYSYKGLKLQTTLGLFTPYRWDKREVYTDGKNLYVNPTDLTGLTRKGYMDNNRRFGNFDVDWTVSVGYQFLKCLQVTLATNLKYYNGVMIPKSCGDQCEALHGKNAHAHERVQFQGVIGLGVGYSF